ncbi:DUF7507 domain-containing protein [Plantibacter sp. YIM 135249]|uniref:DUF7507 domain-containing protein n=1 Tax=Plantibacter sp. YIM 135249 TaxID=3423918 RepID=UPI003D340A42
MTCTVWPMTEGVDRAGLRRARHVGALAGAMLLALIFTGGAAAVAQPAGPVLLDEDFRGAAVIPSIDGYGSACLTGAPVGPEPAAGAHVLSGCAATATGPVPPQGGAPDGYLRLTDASNNQAGAVLSAQPIPSTSGVEISFEQWQYGGTQTPAPADGISFFLVDGAATLDDPGAFGGSLGYAQKLPDDNPANTLIPGVNHGYLGIGMDVLGNYFGDWEHRGQNCPTRSPAGTGFRAPAPGTNMVTVRGPGDGADGYCFLAATTSNSSTTSPWPSMLPGQLHGPLTSIPAGTTAADAAALLEPSKRTVTIVITPAPDPQVTVSVDFGAGPQQVLAFDAPQPVPATYKFGFAASTGGFTDVHLIRTVKVQALEPLPALDLVKQVTVHPGPPPVYGIGDTIPYEFVATNSGGGPLTDLTIADPLVASISCPTTTLGVGESVTCTGEYLVTTADVARGYVVNTAIATGTSPGGAVNSPPSEVTTPLGSPVSLSLQKHVDDSAPYTTGDTVLYEYIVSNESPTTVTDIAVVDNKLSGVACDSDTLQPADQPSSSTVCHGSYIVTAADTSAGSVTNIATASGNGGTVTSPPADATIILTATTPTEPPSTTPTSTTPPVSGASTAPELAKGGFNVAFPFFGGIALILAGAVHWRRTRKGSR